MSGLDEGQRSDGPTMRPYAPQPKRAPDDGRHRELELKSRQQKIQIAWMVVVGSLGLLLLHATTHYTFLHAHGEVVLRADRWTGAIDHCTPARGCGYVSRPIDPSLLATPAADATARQN